MRMLHRLEDWLSTLRRDEEGASAVEFAIVCSIFIAMCIAIVQFGMALQIRNDLAQAADRGARLIVLNPDATDQDLETQVEALLASYNSANLLVDVGEATINSIEYRTVTINYQIQIAIPGLPLNVMTLNASRQVPVFS